MYKYNETMVCLPSVLFSVQNNNIITMVGKNFKFRFVFCEKIRPKDITEIIPLLRRGEKSKYSACREDPL
jgi:hypothetical protein